MIHFQSVVSSLVVSFLLSSLSVVQYLASKHGIFEYLSALNQNQVQCFNKPVSMSNLQFRKAKPLFNFRLVLFITHFIELLLFLLTVCCGLSMLWLLASSRQISIEMPIQAYILFLINEQHKVSFML